MRHSKIPYILDPVVLPCRERVVDIDLEKVLRKWLMIQVENEKVYELHDPAPGLYRRTFTRRHFPRFLNMGTAALTFTSLALSRVPAITGPFKKRDWNSIVPVDKKLHPAWVSSLFERGQPTVYSKFNNELRFIGMPVGGISFGTLYLSGDGRLWCWDIFNLQFIGILPRSVPWSNAHRMCFAGLSAMRPTDGASYVRPHTSEETPLIAQGFAIRTNSVRGNEVRKLEASDWAGMPVTDEYPITPENFKASFTAAQGWGTFLPQLTLHSLQYRIVLCMGRLRLNSIALEAPIEAGGFLRILLDQTWGAGAIPRQDACVVISFNSTCDLNAGQTLAITFA